MLGHSEKDATGTSLVLYCLEIFKTVTYMPCYVRQKENNKKMAQWRTKYQFNQDVIWRV